MVRTWWSYAPGLALGLDGTSLGQLTGIAASLSVSGELSEWGEDPPNLGLVLRTCCEILLPALAATVGLHIGTILRRRDEGSPPLAATLSGAFSGAFVGWCVSYLLPMPLGWALATGVGTFAGGVVLGAAYVRRWPARRLLGYGALVPAALLTALVVSEYVRNPPPHLSLGVTILSRAEGQTWDRARIPAREARPKEIWVVEGATGYRVFRETEGEQWGVTAEGKDAQATCVTPWGYSSSHESAYSLSEQDSNDMSDLVRELGYHFAHPWMDYVVMYRIDVIARDGARISVRILDRRDGATSDTVMTIGTSRMGTFMPEAAPVGIRIEVLHADKP